MAKRQQLTGIGRPVRRVQASPDADPRPGRWPGAIPAVRQLLADGLDLGPVTVLVGDNGTGKSTIVEAIAEAYGLNPEGGSTGARARHPAHRVVPGRQAAARPRRRRGAGAATSCAPRRCTPSTPTWRRTPARLHDGVPRAQPRRVLPGADRRPVLHDPGPGVPGSIVLDEPESALSFASCLRVLATLRDLTRRAAGRRCCMATHSPVLAALPGATILELTDAGFRPSAWDDLDLVTNDASSWPSRTATCGGEVTDNRIGRTPMRSMIRLLGVARELWPFYLGIVLRPRRRPPPPRWLTPFIIKAATDEVVAQIQGKGGGVQALLLLGGRAVRRRAREHADLATSAATWAT